MKTLIIAALLLMAVNASANDWDVLRDDVQQISGCDIGEQSSLSERYDPPIVMVEIK